jgi:phosphopantetheinyl transferase (holo-ACP synthase)
MHSVVGDDVVDLTDPGIAHHYLCERFVSRVCADDERPSAATSVGLWSLFAAKEAAYKALVKMGRDPGFAHREIRVARDFRTVRFRERELRLRVRRSDRTVHAVAWNAGRGAPLARTARTAEPEGRAARTLLCGIVAAAVGCSARELVVVRDPVDGAWDGFGPPRVERRGARLDVDVTLSHDGTVVGAAVLYSYTG